jgi:hypothetical protein
MIDFNAGTYEGGGKLGDLKTYRDGGIGIPVRVANDEKASVLLKNVNKICRVTVEHDGRKASSQGELLKLTSLRNGGVKLDFFMPNEPKTGSFFLANVTKEVNLKVEFSSVKGDVTTAEEDSEDDDHGQAELDGLGDAGGGDGPPTPGSDPE